MISRGRRRGINKNANYLDVKRATALDPNSAKQTRNAGQGLTRSSVPLERGVVLHSDYLSPSCLASNSRNHILQDVWRFWLVWFDDLPVHTWQCQQRDRACLWHDGHNTTTVALWEHWDLGINYGEENTRAALEGTTFTDVISTWVEKNWDCKDD